MNEKKITRMRRAKRVRMKIRELGVHRLCIHRTTAHIYAQIITSDASRTLASASTLERDLAKGLKATGNVEAAKKIGLEIAKRAKAQGISKVAFDRAGFKYHGRVKALADAAREGGLQF